MGDRKIKLLYGDNAEEFEKAASMLEIPFDNSVPNRKQTNAIVERTNLYLEDQVATCLVAAGLPPCYWEFALQCYTLLHNTEKVNGQSPWELTFGGREFCNRRPDSSLAASGQPKPAELGSYTVSQSPEQRLAQSLHWLKPYVSTKKGGGTKGGPGLKPRAFQTLLCATLRATQRKRRRAFRFL